MQKKNKKAVHRQAVKIMKGMGLSLPNENDLKTGLKYKSRGKKKKS